MIIKASDDKNDTKQNDDGTTDISSLSLPAIQMTSPISLKINIP